MQCINILASKNTGELRSQMKTLGLFELRDNLLMLILRYEIKTEKFHKILEGFSFENLANQSKFKESHSLAYLLKILTDKNNSSALQVKYLDKKFFYCFTLNTETIIFKQISKFVFSNVIIFNFNNFIFLYEPLFLSY